MLFHYFNNKKDLFLFLYDYTVDMIANEFFGKIDLNERDVFLRLKQIALLKSQIIKKHPEVYNFILAAYIEDSGEVKNDLEQRNKEFIAGSYSKAFEGLDFSKFKEGVDVSKAMKIIMWTMEGFAAQEQEKLKLNAQKTLDFDQAFLEFDNYLDMLKECFYKA